MFFLHPFSLIETNFNFYFRLKITAEVKSFEVTIFAIISTVYWFEVRLYTPAEFQLKEMIYGTSQGLNTRIDVTILLLSLSCNLLREMLIRSRDVVYYKGENLSISIRRFGSETVLIIESKSTSYPSRDHFSEHHTIFTAICWPHKWGDKDRS